MMTRPAAAPEASTNPRNAPPASALVDISARWECRRSVARVETKPAVNRF
jgi:hypothetical protein